MRQALILTLATGLLNQDDATQQGIDVERIKKAAMDSEIFMLGLQQKIDSLKTILSVAECSSDDILKILNHIA